MSEQATEKAQDVVPKIDRKTGKLTNVDELPWEKTEAFVVRDGKEHPFFRYDGAVRIDPKDALICGVHERHKRLRDLPVLSSLKDFTGKLRPLPKQGWQGQEVGLCGDLRLLAFRQQDTQYVYIMPPKDGDVRMMVEEE